MKAGRQPGDVVAWRRVMAGDNEAFGELFDRYAGAVYTHLYRRLGDWASAEDLTSVMFLQAWRRRAEVMFERESALPWLLGVANGLLRNETRARRRHAALLGRIRGTRGETPWPADVAADHAEAVADQVDAERRMRAVRAAVARLPRREREVIELCVWAGLDHAAAARALDVRPGTVKSRLHRARRDLARQLGAAGQDIPDPGTARPGAGQPGQPEDGPARPRLARRSGWLAPLAAAAAVLVIASAAFGLQTLLRAGNGERTGHPGAAGTSVAGTVTATGSSVSAGPAPVAGSRPVSLPGGRWQVTRQYRVNAPVSSLVVNDPTGSVQVTGGTGSGVSVTAVISYADSAPSISRQLAGGALTVGYSSCGDCGVGFVIAVPRGITVTVREGTGHVGLAGIAGDANVQVGTGSITGTDVSGAVDQFRAGTGGISVRFSAPPARLTAKPRPG